MEGCRTHLGKEQGAALPPMTAVVLVSRVGVKAPFIAMELEGGNDGFGILAVNAVRVNRGLN